MLVREKAAKYTLIRVSILLHSCYYRNIYLIQDESVCQCYSPVVLLQDPLYLSHCVVFSDPEMPDVFEILDMNKETFILKVYL